MNNAKYYITKGNSMRGMVNELKSLRTDILESMKSAYPMPYETILHRLNEIIKIGRAQRYSFHVGSIGDGETKVITKLKYKKSESVKRLTQFRTSLVKSMSSTCPMPYSTVVDMLSDIINAECHDIHPDSDADVAKETDEIMDIKDPDDTVKRLVDWITELKNGILDSMNAPYPIPYEMIAHELDKIANELRGIIRPGKVSEDTHTNDPVHHPKHYELMPGVEVKDVIHAIGNKPSELTGWQEFCKGNVLKYMLRAEDKNGMEDYEKAAVYLGWLLEDYGEDR